MADVLILIESFNEYADAAALAAVWTQIDGDLSLSTVAPLPPDGSQYLHAVASGNGDELAEQVPWGTHQALRTHVFTGLTPGGHYRLRWTMDVGKSFGNFIAAAGSHTFTAGLQANSDYNRIALLDPIGGLGVPDAGIPADVVVYDTANSNSPDVGAGYPALDGWKDYSLLTTADGSGEITVTLGKFDGRNFSSNIGIDALTLWLVPPPPPTFAAPAAVQARGGACYLDSFLEYDGRNVAAPGGLFESVTVVLSGGSTWAAGETLTLTALGVVFVSGDVGNVLILHSDDDLTKVRFTIAGFTSGTVVTGTANVAIPSSMQSATIAVWDKAVDQVAGLAHLEQEFVGVLADDHVVGSPNNARITRRQVVDGSVALGDFYTHVFVGLSYLSDLETLDIDKPSGSTLKGQTIDVTRVGLMLLQSRPCFIGGQPPTSDAADPLEDLEELPIPTDPTYEDLVTGYREVNIKNEWNSNGCVFVRSVDPVPHTVLAVVPNGYFPSLG